MTTLFGQPVIVNPLCDNVPRMQLLPATRAIVTPEFAAKMNQWMLEFFGIADQVYQLAGGTIVLGPKSLARLRAVAGQESMP
jgi:hypothetical protein